MHPHNTGYVTYGNFFFSTGMHLTCMCYHPCVVRQDKFTGGFSSVNADYAKKASKRRGCIWLGFAPSLGYGCAKI